MTFLQYWRGPMDWPLDRSWTCEVCETRSGLTWGMRHSHCRCNQCHMAYYMRDLTQEDQPAVTTPIPDIRQGWLEPARWGWNEWGKTLFKWTPQDWRTAFEALNLDLPEALSEDAAAN